MPMKVVLFAGDQQSGWSEKYYNGSLGDIGATYTAFQNVLNARWTLVGEGPLVLAIRISDPTRRRRFQLFDYRARAQPINYVGQTQGIALPVKSDNPYSNVNITLYAGEMIKGRMFLGGVPDAFILDQLFSPPRFWTDYFRAFITALSSQGWAIQSSFTNPLPNSVPIKAFTTGPGGTEIQLPGTNYPLGTRIMVEGCRDFNRQRVNRLYTLTTVSDPPGTYGVNPGWPSLDMVRLGTATLRGVGYWSVTGGDFGGPASHRRGAPFFRPHGRRKIRAIPL